MDASRQGWRPVERHSMRLAAAPVGANRPSFPTPRLSVRRSRRAPGVRPPGFKRIRHYGLLSPARKKDALAAARAALGVPTPQPAAIESVAAFLRRVSQIEHLRFPHCARGQFRLVAPIAPQRHLVNARGPP